MSEAAAARSSRKYEFWKEQAEEGEKKSFVVFLAGNSLPSSTLNYDSNRQ